MAQLKIKDFYWTTCVGDCPDVIHASNYNVFISAIKNTSTVL